MAKKPIYFTEQELLDVWGGANFGPQNNENKEDFVRESLWQVAQGYSTGSTIMQIMTELGLLQEIQRGVRRVSKKGMEFLRTSTAVVDWDALLQEWKNDPASSNYEIIELIRQRDLYRTRSQKHFHEIKKLEARIETLNANSTIEQMRSDTLTLERNEYIVKYHHTEEELNRLKKELGYALSRESQYKAEEDRLKENQIPGYCKDCRFNQVHEATGFKHCVQKSTTEVRIAVPDNGFCHSFKEEA